MSTGAGRPEDPGGTGGRPGGGGWAKAPPELTAAFMDAMAMFPEAARRTMFGYPAAFVNGHMTTGLFASSWFVRLPDDAARDLLAAGGRAFEPMPGRPMKGYVVLPEAVVRDRDALEGWLRRAITYTGNLPPKK